MPAIIILAVCCWFAYGHPIRTVTGWVWPSSEAPWERVDAFYYPNRGDRTRRESELGLASVRLCRAAALQMARRHQDPIMAQGDYACGVGKLEDLDNGGAVYRLTLR